ncbi:MAG: VWA domain-containing protein [Pyrinomonadaceae bacterium]
MPSAVKSLLIILLVLFLGRIGASQDLTRELKVGPRGVIDILNRFGRVAIKAEEVADDKPLTSQLSASSPLGVSESDIKMSGGGSKTLIKIDPADKKKRIDLVLIVPARTSVKIETGTGAIEAVGDFASIEAGTETGTITLDVPDANLEYKFLWTESRPRYVADFEIAEVKEKSAGRFEIKGRRRAEQNADPAEKNGKAKDADKVTLDLTTARGIVLLNVPPSEVMSDLRERPLTEAAKAIIRSGDSLLMEAIRRAAPKYFGDYARSLPPYESQPTFAVRAAGLNIPPGAVKTATVRVTDLFNRAIDGLTARDFEVVENGITRDVTSVSRSTAPFNLVLLLDVSGSVENYVDFIRKAARNFVETVGSDDRVSIVIFNEDVKMLSPFTTDKAKLSGSLDTFDAGGGTAYYDALGYAVSDVLRPLKGGRTAIVILTDGDDNRSFLPFDSLMGSIQESGALVYPVYVPSALIAHASQNPNTDIDPIRKKYMALTAKSQGEGERLAKVSGGVYYPVTQIGQIQKAYEDIVLQMRSAYNVTFRSDAAVAGGSGHSPRLKIRAKRDNAFTFITSVAAVEK